MGRNMFGGHPGPWNKDNPWTGWWGQNPPFHHPVFVLTHHPRPPLKLEGGNIFTFVTDGIESALTQARTAATGKDISLAGGAESRSTIFKRKPRRRNGTQPSPHSLGQRRTPLRRHHHSKQPPTRPNHRHSNRNPPQIRQKIRSHRQDRRILPVTGYTDITDKTGSTNCISLLGGLGTLGVLAHPGRSPPPTNPCCTCRTTRYPSAASRT